MAECSSAERPQRMRVLLLTTSFPLDAGASSGIFVRRLADHLASRVDVTVLTPCSSRRVVPQCSYPVVCFRYAPQALQRLAHQPGGVPVALRAKPWLKILVPFFVVSMLASCLRLGRRADVIHANWSANGLIAGIAGVLLRKPVITTVRGEDVARLEEARFQRALSWMMLSLNARVVSVSDAIRDSLVRCLPGMSDRIVTIPNGVDLPVSGSDRSRRRERDAFDLVTVGSLIPRKDMATVLRALAALTGSPRLVVIGDGVQRVQLEDLAHRLGIGDRVIFAGAVNPDRVVDHLAVGDALVLASRSEGRPNAVLEAFAAGVPVVATDIPGVRELVQHRITGLCFPPGDWRALAERLDELRRDTRLGCSLATGARRLLEDGGLTWERAASDYCALYRAVTAESRPA